MSHYTYSSDLINQMLWSAGERTDGSSSYESKALDYLNRAYEAVCGGGGEIDPNPSRTEPWWWLYTEGTIVLQPLITTGTIAVTENSATATFSDAPASSVAGWHIRVSTDTDVYKISAHTGASTTATLDSVYCGTTATAATYKLFKLDYDLASSVRQLAHAMQVGNSPYQCTQMFLPDMMEQYPLALTTAETPEHFAQVDGNTVRFSSYMESYTRVLYPYVTYPDALTDSASEEPLVPKQWRKILSDFGAYLILLDKNDTRADTYIMMAKATLSAMREENRRQLVSSSTFGAILPRGGHQRFLKTSSGLRIGRRLV